MSRPNPYLRGGPIPVSFLGFESTTLRLQQAGWQIAESYDPDRQETRLAIRHYNGRVAGISNTISRHSLDTRVFCQRYGNPYLNEQPLIVELHIASVLNVCINGAPFPVFRPVDASPRYEDISINDLWHQPYFRPIADGKEIYLKEASMDEILTMALEKQEPEQARIRAAKAAMERREAYRQKATASLILV